MTYEVEIHGRTRRVAIERAAGGLVVSVDGRQRAADVTPIEGLWSLILHDGSPGRGPLRSYEVAVTEHPAGSGALTVHVDGRLVAAAVGGRRASRGRSGSPRASEEGAAGAAPRPVVAPMPGKVVKLLVGAGERVAAGQGVVVVEAMKMENELRAPKAGTVAEIKVSEGASVEAGAVLAVIE